MKIGVISDTHLKSVEKEDIEALFSVLPEEFNEVDLILHAGDLVVFDLISKLSKIAPVEAVSGNMDFPEVGNKLPFKKILNIDGTTIGLTHGSGPPHGIKERVKARFSTKVDLLVYGHTHHPENKVKDGTAYLNPGSPIDKRFADVNSVGFIEISDGKISTEIKIIERD